MRRYMQQTVRKAVGAALMALALTAAAACSSGSGSSNSDDGPSGTVYMLLPNQTTSRYILRDGPQFQKEMKKRAPNVKVVLENANGDPTKQQQQAENAITAGADLLVLLAADQNLSAGILQKAKQSNVPVISYELQANDGPVTSAVLFDPLKVGQNQGKFAAEYLKSLPGKNIPIARVFGNPGEYGTKKYLTGQNAQLKPLIDSGKVKVVCQSYTADWDPTVAQKSIENCLSAQKNNIKAVIAMNDGTALGSIAALKGAKLQGKIPVIGGQDGDLINMRYMLLGWQNDTEYKNIPDLVHAAVNQALYLLEHPDGKVGGDLVNGVYDNGYAKIPAYFVAPTAEKGVEGVKDVVNKGGWTWKEICKAPAATTPTCKEHG